MKTGRYKIETGTWYTQGEWFETEPVTVTYDGILLTVTQHNEKDELQFLMLTNGQLSELKEILNNDDDGRVDSSLQ